MKCNRHPGTEMVQLFSTWACDLCDGKTEKLTDDLRVFDICYNKDGMAYLRQYFSVSMSDAVTYAKSLGYMSGISDITVLDRKNDVLEFIDA